MIWTETFGTARGNAPLGLSQPSPLPIGALNQGGSTVTRFGLLFVGGAKDGYPRAYDVRTGKELWRTFLSRGWSGDACRLFHKRAAICRDFGRRVLGASEQKWGRAWWPRPA
jgi:glucose dehydrogenase